MNQRDVVCPTCQGHSVDVQVSPSKLLRTLLDSLSLH